MIKLFITILSSCIGVRLGRTTLDYVHFRLIPEPMSKVGPRHLLAIYNIFRSAESKDEIGANEFGSQGKEVEVLGHVLRMAL